MIDEMSSIIISNYSITCMHGHIFWVNIVGWSTCQTIYQTSNFFYANKNINVPLIEECLVDAIQHGIVRPHEPYAEELCMS